MEKEAVMRRYKFLTIVAYSLAIFSGSSIAEANSKPVSAIVISDSSGSYASGDKIHPEDTVEIAQGRKLSLVFSDGQTKIIMGPYKSLGTGLSEKTPKLQHWKKLVKNIVMRKGANDVIGGVRGLEDFELFRLDLEQMTSNPVCAARGLYIENSNHTKTVLVKNPKTGVSVNLPAKAVISWPNFFTDTGSYFVLGGALGGRQLDVKIIPEYSLEHLDANGCKDQFEHMLPQFVEFAIDLELE